MRRLILIIPASKIEAANDWVAENTGELGVFRPSVNPTGDANRRATHAVCNWAMDDALFLAMQDEFQKPGWAAFIGEGDVYLSGAINTVDGVGFMQSKGLRGMTDRP